MTIKRIMGILAIVIIGGIGGFIFILYATVKTKSTSLNKYEPFSEWVGKTVTLDRETVLFDEKVGSYTDGKYPYLLLDSLHPQWRYRKDRENSGDMAEIARLPVGTQMTFDKAVQYTNGVSGFSYPIFHVTLSYNGKNYKAGYQWGERSMERTFDKMEKNWTFHKAPWQQERDTSWYNLPTATFW